MTLESAIASIGKYAERMNALYGKVFFDELAVICLTENKARILNYLGPRKDDFQKNFSTDIKVLRVEITVEKHGIGDFEFARHASGTHFDAFMVLGQDLYLICNNTSRTISGLTQDERWLKAQVPFAELAEEFRADPLSLEQVDWLT